MCIRDRPYYFMRRQVFSLQYLCHRLGYLLRRHPALFGFFHLGHRGLYPSSVDIVSFGSLSPVFGEVGLYVIEHHRRSLYPKRLKFYSQRIAESVESRDVYKRQLFYRTSG